MIPTRPLRDMLVQDRPTLQALALFAAVIRHGTMTAAAEAVGISQPAISAQIRVLERHYNTRLLQREDRGSFPTPAGRLVADYATRVVTLVDELERAVAELENLSTGALVVGASTTVGEHLLPTYRGRFHLTHPGVRLSVKIGNSAEVTRMVVDRALDFAIVGQQPADPDLLVEPVLRDRIVAFVAPGDPLLDATPIDPPALCGRQFVMREMGSATRALAETCLSRASCGPGHVIELGSNEAVKRAVEAGLGIGLLSTHAIEAERMAGLLHDLPIAGWRRGRSFWLIQRRDRTLTRAAQAFLALLPRQP